MNGCRGPSAANGFQVEIDSELYVEEYRGILLHEVI